jgi:nitrogen fixation protein FixH
MRRTWFWPAVVIVVLGLTVGGNIWVAVIANADPSFAIEENYYQRAVGFDAERAREQRSDRLGWALELTAGPTSDVGTPLTAVLRDSTGAVVADANVRVQLRQVARSQTTTPATLVFGGAGYSALVPMFVEGLWDVEVEARRGPARFTAQRRVDLTRGS